MGPGKMLGIEDIARLSGHCYEAKCVSQTGTILKIDVDKLYNIIKIIAGGFEEVQKLNLSKWKNYIDRLTVLEEQNNYKLKT